MLPAGDTVMNKTWSLPSGDSNSCGRLMRQNQTEADKKADKSVPVVMNVLKEENKGQRWWNQEAS